MSQLNKSISKPRDPPPSLFLHPSPGASHVSLAQPGTNSNNNNASHSSSQLTAAGGVGGGGGGSSSGSLQPLGKGIAAGILNHHHHQTSPPQSRPGSSAFPPNSTQFTSPGAAASSILSSMTSPGGGGGGGATPGGLGSVSSPLRGGLNISNLPVPHLLPRQESSSRATDKTDARWAKMQVTLEEIDLSASGGTRIFGPDHEKKLDELRAAQIALAHAWARSEADEAIETVRTDGGGVHAGAPSSAAAAGLAGGGGGGEGAGTAVGGATTEGGKSTVGSLGSVPARPGSSGLGIGTSTAAAGTGAGIAGGHDSKKGTGVEQETEVNILLARKRREANDRYFQRVNQGVLDVVAKLEEVAVAMRAVELESKEVWEHGGDNESVHTMSSKP